MTRLATFFLGLALGAAVVVMLLIVLRMTPHMRVTLDWSPAGATAARMAPTVSKAPQSVLATWFPSLATAAPRPGVVAPAAPAMLFHALAPGAATVDVESPPLLIPVAGVKATELVDTFADARSGGRVHDAIDIMAARGTPVLAASDGKLVKLFTSKQGGLTIYQFDPGQTHAFYYAHLDAYAPGIREGSELKRGDVIGRVGSTGNASIDAPHLHFAVFVLGPERNWWQGVAIDPYPLLAKQEIRQ
jgi:murein DD-endopeptidase MepM/ murein hydrolase activator NlpD